MSAAQLRIQLEGKYEVVEAAAGRFDLAVKSLRRSGWTRDMRWQQLTPLTGPEKDALAELVHKAERQRSGPGLGLARRAQDAERAMTALLSKRLKAFGSDTSGPIDEQIARLAKHLPLRFELDQRPFWWAAAGVVAVAGVVALIATRSPPALLLLCFSGALLLAGSELAERIAVTQLALVLNDFATPLKEVALVEFEYGGRNGCTVDVTTVAGAHRQLLLGSGGANGLDQTLHRLGVKVLDRRGGGRW